MRAALYTRVSTEDQAKEGFSLDAQMKRLEAYCKARGWTVGGRYTDDGYSGRTIDKRPAYQEMMNHSDDWDVLLVLKMDRIHRNSVNFTTMMDDLKKNGKEFNSIQEKFDTTSAMGRFVMDIIQRIAQLESEQIGERVKMGMKRKVKHGTGTLGSGHPYGYAIRDGRLEVELDEAVTVRAIYRMHLRGASTEKIAASLNDAFIPAKKGGSWNRQSVWNILHNPLYIGFTVWDEISRKNTHDPIVEESIFRMVNNKIPV